MSDKPDDTDQMVKISELIADLQAIHKRYGDTCVYIRRGGMSWGAVALNRRDDDRQNGVFDLQATHDKVMGQLAAQVSRLRTDRDQWRSLYWKVAVKPGDPIPFDVERLLADIGAPEAAEDAA